jgi:hypothetical protein
VRFSEEVQKRVDAGEKLTLLGRKVKRAREAAKPDELYDLKSDPQERKNLAGEAEHAETLARMKGLMAAHCRRLPHGWGEFSGGG